MARRSHSAGIGGARVARRNGLGEACLTYSQVFAASSNDGVCCVAVCALGQDGVEEWAGLRDTLGGMSFVDQ